MGWFGGTTFSVGGFCGGVARPIPGRKNISGETLWLAVTPPQPVSISIALTAASKGAHRFTFIGAI